MLSLALLAQEQRKSLDAVSVPPGSITLDGKLDEEVWLAISPSGGFTQTEPVEGGSPTEPTEIRIAYDEDNLYIGVICYDSNPSQIKAFQKRRDVSLRTDERFMWILDTFQDGRNAYFFETNPLGLMGDGLLTIGQGSSINKSWDAIWYVEARIDEEGWKAEIRIPFMSIGFDRKNSNWGINFQRTIRRKNEELLWTGYRRNQGLFRPQNAGTLKGLEQITQGIGLEVIPYVAGRRRTERDSTDTMQEKYEGDFGFDVNYNITPGLRASFTYNTDFAEAEVDDQQINLTRFRLVFPEKRDFFLEGANIFQFAPRSFVTPYFSRRIGLRDGEPIPITYGARILGRVQSFDVALLHVRTDPALGLNAEHFSVGRIRKNFWKESRFGLVYTRRQTIDGETLSPPLQDRHTIGADLELNTSEFLGDENLQFSAFFVYHNPATTLDDSTEWHDRTARGIRLNLPNQPWSGHISYREFGVAYDPAVGIQPRVGFRRVQPSVNYNPLFEQSDVIRSMSWGVFFEHLMDLDFELLTQQLNFDLWQTTFETGDNFSFYGGRNFERLTEDFDILRDSTIIIPAGNYVNWGGGIELESASFRRLVGEIEINHEGFWSGTNTEYNLELTVRVIPGINISGEYSHADISLAEGAFSTDIFRLDARFDLTPLLSISTLWQYDNISDRMGVNNRLRWIITPGSDLFLVYNHNWIDEPALDRFRTVNSIGTLKVNYTHRF